MIGFFGIVFFSCLIQLGFGQCVGPCFQNVCPSGLNCVSGMCCLPAPITTTLSPTVCVDLASNCAANVNLCSNSLYYSLMTSQCARTCGRCTSTTTTSTCVNLASNCAANVNLCSNSLYYSLMTAQCALTCGRCTSTTVSTCVDKVNPSTGISDCPSRAYLCNNTVYYTLMTQQCPATCKRCTSG